MFPNNRPARVQYWLERIQEEIHKSIPLEELWQPNWQTDDLVEGLLVAAMHTLCREGDTWKADKPAAKKNKKGDILKADKPTAKKNKKGDILKADKPPGKKNKKCDILQDFNDNEYEYEHEDWFRTLTTIKSNQDQSFTDDWIEDYSFPTLYVSIKKGMFSAPLEGIGTLHSRVQSLLMMKGKEIGGFLPKMHAIITPDEQFLESETRVSFFWCVTRHCDDDLYLTCIRAVAIDCGIRLTSILCLFVSNVIHKPEEQENMEAEIEMLDWLMEEDSTSVVAARVVPFIKRVMDTHKGKGKGKGKEVVVVAVDDCIARVILEFLSLILEKEFFWCFKRFPAPVDEFRKSFKSLQEEIEIFYGKLEAIQSKIDTDIFKKDNEGKKKDVLVAKLDHVLEAEIEHLWESICK